MLDQAAERYQSRVELRHRSAVGLAAAADVAAKAALLVMIVLVLLDPAWGNLEGKAPVGRAVTYPMLAFVLPAW